MDECDIILQDVFNSPDKVMSIIVFGLLATLTGLMGFIALLIS